LLNFPDFCYILIICAPSAAKKMKTGSEIAKENAGSGTTPLQCQNCGLKLAGEFCHDCGQSAAVDRYTFKSFVV
jgi:hypothetical protein